MLKPVWIGRFQVMGPRNSRYLNGYSAAYLWVASQAEDVESLQRKVGAALKINDLTVTHGDRFELIVDDPDRTFEIKALVRDARRNPDSVACGVFQGFEDHAGRRPMLLEVKTERLLLRPWEPRDRLPFAALNADRDVMTFLPRTLTRPQSDEAVDQFLADGHRTGFGFLAAELKTSQLTGGSRSFVGVMGLRVMHDVLPKVQQPAVELGFQLAREHQRKGLGEEGGRALLQLAFRDFQLAEVVAITSVGNLACRRVLEKIGMRHRAEFEFIHPAFPARHLYARHTLYSIRNPQ